MNRWSDRLYAIVDAETSSDPEELARRALSVGCAALQLRAKTLDDQHLLALAEQLNAACKQARVPFVVNDRPDIATLIGADGLHLGQDDMRIAEAREIVGEIDIGVSTHNLRQALEADRDGADRIAFGPVFETTTKENPDPVVGLKNLEEVCRSVSCPVVAIGGITPENGARVLDHGATQLAVISALPRFLVER
ncbi:MAG: thiamine phosphate synthase [Myxococcales bacterium]|nr:thiamine phosphate synthase [Myxococcales bacterium]MDH3842877.1 thiamine phosphate synthase [Myxococcales bacterium]